jgi:hypothetical protein
MAGAMTDTSVTPVVCRPRVSPLSLAPSPYMFPGGPEQLTA